MMNKKSIKTCFTLLLAVGILASCSQHDEVKPSQKAPLQSPTTSLDETSANGRGNVGSYFELVPQDMAPTGDHKTFLKIRGKKRLCAASSLLIRYEVVVFNATTGREESRTLLLQEEGRNTCIIPLGWYGILSEHLDAFDFISYTPPAGKSKIVQVHLVLWDLESGQNIGYAYTNKILLPLQ